MGKKNLTYRVTLNSQNNLFKVGVDIVESAAGDHYIELGGEGGDGPRSYGKRTVNGVTIR